MTNQLSLHSVDGFEHISVFQLVIPNNHGGTFESELIGWILEESERSIYFLNVDGQEFEIEKSWVVEKTDYSQSASYKNYYPEPSNISSHKFNFGLNYDGRDLVPYILISMWMRNNESLEIFEKVEQVRKVNLETELTDMFANLYYNQLLEHFTYSRSFEEALKFAKHLQLPIFDEFSYNIEVDLLTAQLEKNSQDFITFCLPDTINWSNIKSSLTREEQIEYLLTRIRLLNFLPQDFDYTNNQYSISYSSFSKKAKVASIVINPYNELRKLEMTPKEMLIVVEYLKNPDEFIASFSYWRDYTSVRKLHSVSRVIYSLLSNITGTNFGEGDLYLSSPEAKANKIDLLEQWVKEHVSSN